MNLFYDLDGKERMTSEVFRYLFMNCISFRNNLLTLLRLPKFDDYICLTEYTKHLDGRRVDICIKSDSSITFIENKIWHSLHSDQPEDYRQGLEKHTDIPLKNKRLFILHPAVRNKMVDGAIKWSDGKIKWEDVVDFETNPIKDSMECSVIASMLKDFVKTKIGIYSDFEEVKSELKKIISFRKPNEAQRNFIETISDVIIQQIGNIYDVAKSTGMDYHGVYIKLKSQNSRDIWIWVGLSSRQFITENDCMFIFQYPKVIKILSNDYDWTDHSKNQYDANQNNYCYIIPFEKHLEQNGIDKLCEIICSQVKILLNSTQ